MKVLRNFILLLVLIQNEVVSEVSPDTVGHIWNKMGGKWDPWWELWSGLGICSNDQSLINEITHESCIRRKCLLSWSSSSLVDLNLLRTSSASSSSPTAPDYQYHGSLLECALPLGGQIRSKDQVVEVSFIMTLGNNDQQASLSILELYRSAHEVKSSEFIFIKELGSTELPITYRFINNLQKLFNANVKLLMQSSISKSSFRLNSNEAIAHANGEYIALLDDSIIVTPSWISLLLSTLKSPPFVANIGVIGPLLITPQGKVSEAGGILYSDLVNYTTGYGSEPNKMTNFQVRIVDFLNSKCLIFKKSLFQEIQFQLFDPKYETDYGRDVDVAMGLLQKGYVSVLQPLAVVIYDSEMTAPPSLTSSLQADVHYLQHKYSSLLTTESSSSSSSSSPFSISFCPYRFISSCTQTLPPTRLHDLMSMYRQSNRILVLDLIPPEPDKDAGSIRLQEIFNILHQLGFQISFQPNSTGRHVKYALELLYQGIQYLYPGTIRQLSKYIQKYGAHEELEECPWDVVIACRRSVIDKYINHIKRLCPMIPIIFDTVDVHFIREQRAFYRQLELQKLLETTSATSTATTTSTTLVTTADSKDIKKDMKKEFLILSENTVREVLLMMVSNITYVVSSTEYETIHQLMPSLDVRIVSNIYHPPNSLPIEDPIHRNGALFVGSMCHPPNVDALHFIVDEILFLNKTFPNEFYFHIVVSRSLECPQNDALHKIQSHPLVRLYYDVTNQFLQKLHSTVKVVLAPVLVGAGVKGKVNYALLHGVPVISTSIGAEGMYLETRKSFLLANTGLEFYTSIMELYQDTSLWQKLRNGGLEVMKNHFSRQVAQEMIQKSLFDLNVLPNQLQQQRQRRQLQQQQGQGYRRGEWQCPKEMSSSCPSIIHSDQMTLPISSIDSKVLTQQPPNNKQEYFNLSMRYPHIRLWRSEIMKLFNISLPY
jgi:O-antigen biosynthesis protein